MLLCVLDFCKKTFQSLLGAEFYVSGDIISLFSFRFNPENCQPQFSGIPKIVTSIKLLTSIFGYPEFGNGLTLCLAGV